MSNIMQQYLSTFNVYIYMYDVDVQYMLFGSMKCNWRLASWLVLVYLLVII